jgi:hypothetical protein
VLDGKLVACARDPQLPLKFTVRGMASTFGVQGSQGLNCRWADSDERNLRLADQRAKGRVRKVAERARVLNTGDKETRLLADARGRSSIRRSSPSRSRRCARRFIRIAAPWTTARKGAQIADYGRGAGSDESARRHRIRKPRHLQVAGAEQQALQNSFPSASFRATPAGSGAGLRA